VQNTSIKPCFVAKTEEVKKEPKKPKKQKPEPKPTETETEKKNSTMLPIEETSGNITNGNDLSQTKKLAQKHGHTFVEVVA